MGYMCDFCGEQRSMVYCRSDAACLCLSCDRNVHSANALSKRHSRTLLCERCNSQPALVRCAEEKASLCQNCDWVGHGSSASSSTHKRQTINCYSGCPSAEEFSSLWSFFIDIPADDSTCEQELSLMKITENSSKNSECQVDNMKQGVSPAVELKNSSICAGSSIPEPKPCTSSLNEPGGSVNPPLPKVLLIFSILDKLKEIISFTV